MARRHPVHPSRLALVLLLCTPGLGCPGVEVSGVDELVDAVHATWVERRYEASEGGEISAGSSHEFVLTALAGYCEAVQGEQAANDAYVRDLADPDIDDCGAEGNRLEAIADAMGPFSAQGQVTLWAGVSPDDPAQPLSAGTYSVGGQGANRLTVFLTRHLANVPEEQLAAFDPSDSLCRDPAFEFTQPSRELFRSTVASLDVGSRAGASRRITLSGELASEDGTETVEISAEGPAQHCVVDAGVAAVVGR